jgi:quinol monooxygenase YgiN
MSHVVTYFDVQPGSVDAAIKLMRRYREACTAEEGNSWTYVLREIHRQNRFVIVEAWKDEAAFRAHDAAGHTEQFRSALKAIHNSPHDQRIHQVFSIGLKTRNPEPGELCLVTHVDVPPPRKDETEVLLRAESEISRKDEGNGRYDVYQQLAPRTNHFSVFVVWKDEQAFASHEATPHTQQFRETLGPMLGAPYDERLYRLLA